MEGRGGRGDDDRQKSRVKADEGCREERKGVCQADRCQDADDFCTSFFMRFCGFFCSIAVNCAGGERREKGG